MREGPPWIAIASATARATVSVHVAPLSPVNVDYGLQIMVVHGNMNLSLEDFSDAPAVNHLRGHQFKVRQPRLQLARQQAAFLVQVVGTRNKLPPSVAEAPLFNAFKDRLDIRWETIFSDND